MGLTVGGGVLGNSAGVGGGGGGVSNPLDADLDVTGFALVSDGDVTVIPDTTGVFAVEEEGNPLNRVEISHNGTNSVIESQLGTIELHSSALKIMEVGTEIRTYRRQLNNAGTTTNKGDIGDNSGNPYRDIYLRGGCFLRENTTADPDVWTNQITSYMKGTKYVLAYDDSGTKRYKYLDMAGTGVTWVHTTTAP